MKFIDLIYLSLQVFRRRTSRTILTIVGVGVGIGAVFFFVSLGFGLQELILERITTREAFLTLDVTASPGGAVRLNAENIERIRKIDGVSDLSPLVVIPGQAVFGDRRADVVYSVISPSFLRLGAIRPELGEIFKEGDMRSAILTTAALKVLSLSGGGALNREFRPVLFVPETGAEIGGLVNVIQPAETFRVKGVISDEATPMIFVSREDFWDVSFPEPVQLKVAVKDTEILVSVRDQIINLGFQVEAVLDTVEQVNKIFNAIRITLFVFGFVALVVAAIGMLNTMTISLLERTNDIGVMRALGASRKNIALLFLTESGLIGFLGGVSGVILGYLFGQAVNVIFNILAKALGGEPVSLLAIPPVFVIVTVVFAAVVGIVTGIFPARRAARMRPLEALRYK